MNLDSVLNSLPVDDASVNEVKRIIQKEGELLQKGLRAWLLQYHKESSTKLFLAPVAACIALQLADNSIQKAVNLLCPGVNLPHSAIAIPLFIKSMPQRFMKMGFTGSPVQEQNHLYAQLAWLFVDWSKPHQEQFWKILYPELISVYDGNENTIWPAYGQGILVRNASGEYQSRLINYAQIYKLAQTENGFERLQEEFSAETLRRVYRFYPGHKEFWINVQNKNLPESSYKNYLDFFIALQKFLFDNKYDYNNPGRVDPVTKEITTDVEITPTAQAMFWSRYAPYLKGFINHINVEKDTYRKMFDSTSHQADSGLLGVSRNLLYPSQTTTASCFGRNHRYLRNLLSQNEACELLAELLILPEVHFDKFINESGRDFLPSIAGQHKSIDDKQSLLALMNEPPSEHDIRCPLTYWVTEYKRILKDKAYHIVTLHDFLYEIQNKEESIAFLKKMLGDPLDFSLLVAHSVLQYDEYANKIIGHYPLLYLTHSANSETIKMGLQQGFVKKNIPMPVGFLNEQVNNKALLQAAMSEDYSGEISTKFDEYIAAGKPLSWDLTAFMHLCRELDFKTAEYFIQVFSKNLTQSFLDDRKFFIFLRLFYIAGENLVNNRTSSQEVLFKSIVLPTLSLYCKTAENLATLLEQLYPYASIIFSTLAPKIPSLLNTVSDFKKILAQWPPSQTEQVDLIYAFAKDKLLVLINCSSDLGELEELFKDKPVRSDFLLSLTQKNVCINFRFFVQLYIKSPKETRPSIVGILKKSSLTQAPDFICHHAHEAIHEFIYLTKHIKRDDFSSLITYYQKGITTLIATGNLNNILECISLISNRVWSVFHMHFKEDIENFTTRFLQSLTDFTSLTRNTHWCEGIKRLDIPLNTFIPKVLALIHDRQDFDYLSTKFPINPAAKNGLAFYLIPLMTNALAIYKLLPGAHQKDLSTILPEDFKEFFDEFSSNPVLAQAWKIALLPNEKQRRDALCQILFEENSPGSSSTSSILRFSPSKIKAIMAATCNHVKINNGNGIGK